VAAEQRIDLALGDIDAPFCQLLMQQGLGDVAVMVLVQHIAAQFGAIVSALEVRRQLPTQPLPIRGLPDLHPIADVLGLNLQILDDEVAIPFEPGSRRNGMGRRDRDRLVDRQFLRLGALG